MEEAELKALSSKIKILLEKSKANFTKSINAYFDKIKNSDLSSSENLPQQRKKKDTPDKLIKKQKKEIADSDDENEYDSNKFQNNLNSNNKVLHVKVNITESINHNIDEELSKVYSSENCSLMDTNSPKSGTSDTDFQNLDLEELISKLKSSGNNKADIIIEIEKI